MGLGRNSRRIATKTTKNYDFGSDQEAKSFNYRSRKPKKKTKSSHNSKSKLSTKKRKEGN
jgi:hypothetical protein